MAVLKAYYPNQIRNWPTHRNLLDDVDASHVNNIQLELHAIMRSLGTSPQIFNDIQTDEIPTEAIPNDDGGVIDDDTIWTGSTRFYDPKVKPLDHGTVGQRLDDIERGKQNWAFKLSTSMLPIASGVATLANRPRGIRFPKPPASRDPFALHNGVGVTLRKAGFWLFFGSVTYTLLGSTTGSNNGTYVATIDHDNNFIEAMVREQENGLNDHPVLKPFLAGFFPRGTRVSLRTSHNSGREQRIRMATLSGILLREVIE